MTLTQAIDRNVELKGELISEGRLEKAATVQLGIEALKQRQFTREHYPEEAIPLLPGETEE